MKEKCQYFGLHFRSLIRQPENLVGKPLSLYEPWETESIKADGNCLYRCLSKILTGEQDNHTQLRFLISRFIASEGTSILSWYFKQKETTPFEYMQNENLTHLPGTWGSDVELMAASAMFNVDIFVANTGYRSIDPAFRELREVKWSWLRATRKSEGAFFIKNFDVHYEPVISFINSSTPTYGEKHEGCTIID